MVFLNPPYSAGQLDQWEAKAREEVSKGNTKEVVWLINYGCTRARKRIAQSSSAIVHLHQRVSFLSPETKRPIKGNDRDSMLYLWSPHIDPVRVTASFGTIGTAFFASRRPKLYSDLGFLDLSWRGTPSPRFQLPGNFRFPFT